MHNVLYHQSWVCPMPYPNAGLERRGAERARRRDLPLYSHVKKWSYWDGGHPQSVGTIHNGNDVIRSWYPGPMVSVFFFFLSSPIGGASTSYFKNFCPRPRMRLRSCPRVIWFFRTITLESLNQSEPNFHTWLLSRQPRPSSKMGIAGDM